MADPTPSGAPVIDWPGVVRGDGPLWCHDFDAALPTVVPCAIECLGAMAMVELVTYATPTNGKINCPSAWWTDHGLTAFFSTGGAITPAGYVGGKEVVACTFWEAVQDEWLHDSVVVVDRRFVWKPPSGLMMQLMYDLRGWGEPLSDEQRDAAQENVRRSLVAAATRLEAVLNG